MGDFETFDDFKAAEDVANYTNPLVNDIKLKEQSEVERYKEDVLDDILELSEDPKTALNEMVFDFIKASGDADMIDECNYDSHNGVAIDGWGFNGDEDLTTIDLYISKYLRSEDGKTISKTELEKLFKRLVRFYDQSKSGSIFSKVQIERTSDLYQVTNVINETPKIGRVRFFVITNTIAPFDFEKDSETIEDETACEYYVWDAKRIMQQDDISAGRNPIVVDFDADYNSPLPFVQMPDVSNHVQCYLCIIPGMILAQIYHKYHQQILEMNVRTFLQFKGASNKGIRDTLIGKIAKKSGEEDVEAEPDMFFAYNNGISATADSVTIKETSNGLVITKVSDLQIVNGGQTTAAISAVMAMKGVNYSRLSSVYVSMKISVVKEPEKINEIVPRISKFANTQSAVKKSDFSINEPFLVQLEQFSRQEWALNEFGKPVYKWFFERTRGQFLDKQKKAVGKRSERELEAEYPKAKVFDKPMLSRFMMSWMQYPSFVCWGGETKYGEFVEKMKSQKYFFNEDRYHRTISKLILFKTIDAFYGKSGINVAGYKANMVAYTISVLSMLSNKGLDLDSIWKEQCVISQSVWSEITIPVENVYAGLLIGQNEVTYKIKTQYTDDKGKKRNKYLTHSVPSSDLEKIKNTVLYKIMLFVKDIEPFIWNHLVDVEEGTNIATRSKTSRCWEELRAKINGHEPAFVIPKELITSQGENDTEITESQQEYINDANQYNADTWFSIWKWGKETMEITPRDVAFLASIGYRLKRNNTLSYKQAKYALRLLETAKKKGWKEEEWKK